MATWTDTDFTNINSGGDYTNWYQFPTFHSWDTSVPGEIKDSNGYNIAAVRTADSASGDDQYVEFTVADVSRTYEACVRHPATVTSGEFRGYWCRIQQSGGQWWKNNGYEGGLATHAYSGAGTIRLEVTANVATLLINGNVVDTKDFSASPVASDPHVGFGVAGSGPNPTITYAEGGDLGGGPPPDPVIYPPQPLAWRSSLALR